MDAVPTPQASEPSGGRERSRPARTGSLALFPQLLALRVGHSRSVSCRPGSRQSFADPGGRFRDRRVGERALVLVPISTPAPATEDICDGQAVALRQQASVPAADDAPSPRPPSASPTPSSTRRPLATATPIVATSRIGRAAPAMEIGSVIASSSPRSDPSGPMTSIVAGTDVMLATS